MASSPCRCCEDQMEIIQIKPLALGLDTGNLKTYKLLQSLLFHLHIQWPSPVGSKIAWRLWYSSEQCRQSVQARASGSSSSEHCERIIALESENHGLKSWLFCWLALWLLLLKTQEGVTAGQSQWWREHWSLLTEICHCVLSVFRGMTSSRNGSFSHLEPRSRVESPTYRNMVVNLDGTQDCTPECLWCWVRELAHTVYQSPLIIITYKVHLPPPSWEVTPWRAQSSACWPLLNLRSVGYSHLAVTVHHKVISWQVVSANKRLQLFYSWEWEGLWNDCI